MYPSQPPLLVIAGPTASGKSALAVEVAVGLAGAGQVAEIVNADAMAVYVGMDIGTAKATPAQRALVRHHLIDILSVSEVATVADFQRLARAAIAEIRGRGAVPVLVGGSALYLRAILDDFTFPGTDATIRAQWEDELRRVGSSALHAELARRAPTVAAEILPGNGRRIVRALEVLDLTGDYAPRLPALVYHLSGVRQFALRLDRDQLDARIETRVHRMWQEGLVDEVRGLLAEGLAESLTASRALGYRQALAQLAGELTEEEAIAATITGTKRFARKQLGWFDKDPRITWLDAGANANAWAIMEPIFRDGVNAKVDLRQGARHAQRLRGDA